MVPSGRVIVPSRAWLTPLPAWGAPVTVSGGQAAAQAPVHADVPFVSASNRAKRPEDHPQDARAVLDRLRRAVAGGAVSEGTICGAALPSAGRWPCRPW